MVIAMSVKVTSKNPGWLEKLLARYQNDSALAIGYPSTETGSIKYPDGTSVILVAAVNNFGSASRGIPARRFMQEAAAPAVEASAPVARAMAPLLNEGTVTIEDILKQMGPFAEAAFKKKITDGPWTPNADSTIAKKGSSKPLEDTLLLRNSLTHVVRKGS